MPAAARRRCPGPPPLRPEPVGLGAADRREPGPALILPSSDRVPAGRRLRSAAPARVSHPVRTVAGMAAARGLRVASGNGRRRAPTATSAFGVGRRENHDSAGFYRRFAPPVLSDDAVVEAPGVVDEIYLGDARSMDRVQPRRWPWWSRRRRTSPASSTRRSWARGASRPRTPSTSSCWRACSPSASPSSSPAAASRSTWPTWAASPTGRCRPTSSASCRTGWACCCGARWCGARPGAPGATAPGGRSAARPTRCCATSPSGWWWRPRAGSTGRSTARSGRRGGCRTRPPPRPTSSWRPRSTCGSWRPRAPRGSATRPRSRSSCRSGSSSSTPGGATWCSTRSWAWARRRWRRCARAPLPGLRHRPGYVEAARRRSRCRA